VSGGFVLGPLEAHPVVFFEPGMRRGKLRLMRWREPTHQAVRVVHQQRVTDSVSSVPTPDILECVDR